MKLRHHAAIVSLLAAAAFIQPAVAATDNGISIEFQNNSKWAIHHIYLSPSDTKEWGPDQLGDKDNDVIEPGEKFTLNKISPDKYDLKVVDADGDECVIQVKADQSKIWTITNEALLGCQSATESATSEEGEE